MCQPTNRRTSINHVPERATTDEPLTDTPTRLLRQFDPTPPTGNHAIEATALSEIRRYRTKSAIEMACSP